GSWKLDILRDRARFHFGWCRNFFRNRQTRESDSAGSRDRNFVCRRGRGRGVAVESRRRGRRRNQKHASRKYFIGHAARSLGAVRALCCGRRVPFCLAKEFSARFIRSRWRLPKRLTRSLVGFSFLRPLWFGRD